MKIKTIRQTVSFKISAHDVYDALMDSKKHSKFTGSKTSISKKVGGKFSVYDGYASGKNLELIPGKKIVQSWRAADWEKDAVSTVVFEIIPKGNGTTLKFTHYDVPAEHATAIAQGWKDFYWHPMKKMFNEQ